MFAVFFELSVFEDEDAVGVADGGEAVGDDDGGAPDDDLFEGALDEGFGLVIDGGGGFVEDQDGRVFEDSSCYRNALTLSAAEFLSTFADDGVVALWQSHDEVVGFGDLGGFDDLLVGGVEGAVGDILTHGSVEEENVLADKADSFAQVFDLDVAQIIAVETDVSIRHVVEAQEQFDERGLASTRRADDADCVTGGDVESQIIYNGFVVGVGILK